MFCAVLQQYQKWLHISLLQVRRIEHPFRRPALTRNGKEHLNKAQTWSSMLIWQILWNQEPDVITICVVDTWLITEWQEMARPLQFSHCYHHLKEVVLT